MARPTLGAYTLKVSLSYYLTLQFIVSITIIHLCSESPVSDQGRRSTLAGADREGGALPPGQASCCGEGVNQSMAFQQDCYKASQTWRGWGFDRPSRLCPDCQSPSPACQLSAQTPFRASHEHLTVAECRPASPTPSIPDLPGGPDGSRLLRVLDGRVVSRKGCLGKCAQSKLCL